MNASSFTKGIAASTARTYSSGAKHYLAFCTQSGYSVPLSSSQEILCKFVSHLANEGLMLCTIKRYLSTARHLHISEGLKDPFSKEPLSKLEYVMKGIKKCQAERGQKTRPRLPITPTILCRLRRAWQSAASYSEYDTGMIWAACCLGFFGFLRVGVMTVAGDNQFDSGINDYILSNMYHLCIAPNAPYNVTHRRKV